MTTVAPLFLIDTLVGWRANLLLHGSALSGNSASQHCCSYVLVPYLKNQSRHISRSKPNMLEDSHHDTRSEYLHNFGMLGTLD